MCDVLLSATSIPTRDMQALAMLTWIIYICCMNYLINYQNTSWTHTAVNGYIINNIAYLSYEMIVLHQDYK